MRSTSLEAGCESVTQVTKRHFKKDRLGFKVNGRQVLGGNGTDELLESAASYTGNFDPENDVLRLENTYFLYNIIISFEYK